MLLVSFTAEETESLGRSSWPEITQVRNRAKPDGKLRGQGGGSLFLEAVTPKLVLLDICSVCVLGDTYCVCLLSAKRFTSACVRFFILSNA